MSVNVRERLGGERQCVFCREALADEVVSCQGCGVEVHPECQRELASCPTLGCEGPLGEARCGRCSEPLPATVDRLVCAGCGVSVHTSCPTGEAGCPNCARPRFRFSAGESAPAGRRRGDTQRLRGARRRHVELGAGFLAGDPEQARALAGNTAIFVTLVWAISSLLFAGLLGADRAYPNYNPFAALAWIAWAIPAGLAAGAYRYLVERIGVQRPPLPGAKLMNVVAILAAMFVGLPLGIGGLHGVETGEALLRIFAPALAIYAVILIPVLRLWGFDLPEDRS